MSRNRIIGAVSALALLAAPAVAVAHGNSHHHHSKHHARKAHTREVTGKATATVASFTDGALTLALPSGKTFTADVTQRTLIVCHTAPATKASHGGGDNSGRGGKDDGDRHDQGDDHGDDPTTTAPASTTVPPTTTTPVSDDPANHDANDDHGVNGRCATDALVAGAKVRDAKLALKNGAVVWTKIVVVK